MSVTTLTQELAATSRTGPEEAVRQAVARVRAEMAEVEHVEVKRVEVLLQDSNVSGYRVTLEVTHTGEGGSERPVAVPLPLGPDPVPLRTDDDGVVRVGGTRIPLDTVIVAFRLGETAEGIVESYPTLRLADVYQVLGYYLLHREAADTYIAQREGEATQLREEIEADFDPTGVRARLLARRAGEQ